MACTLIDIPQKILSMKSLSSILFACSFLIVPACNDNRTETASTYDSDTTVYNADKTAITGENTDTMNATPLNAVPDSSFIKEALSGGMMEVELGKLAIQKAKDKRVKSFGSMMVTDHSKANSELKQLATSVSVQVGDGMSMDHKQHIADMKKKSGDAFDKDYMSMMVDDHQKDIAKFNDAARSNDNNVKSFATKTLPVLQKHLDSANAIKNSQ
jgi:putative membrane protein